MMSVTREELKEIQRLAIVNALKEFVGQSNTPDTIDKMVEKLTKEMQEGPSAWAFSEGLEHVR